MVKNNPLLTICIPTFNRAAYLSETIQSVLSQTYTNFELIIINDGCTDNTDSIVKSYRDKRIQYLKNKENLGYIKTMNKGTQLAKSEWIMHVSDDDTMRPTMLEEMIDALGDHTNQKIGFVVPQSANINEKGDLISEPKKQLTNKKNILLKPKDFIFNFTLYGKKIHDKYVFNTSFPSTLFNRRILIELGMSSENVPVSHDILIESKICLLYPVIVIDQPLFNYRVHQNLGSSLNKSGAFLKEYRHFLELLLFFVKERQITFSYDFKQYCFDALVGYLFSINGGLVRIAARYDNGYTNRLAIVREYLAFGLAHRKKMLFSPQFYFVMLLSLLPQPVLLITGKLVGKI